MEIDFTCELGEDHIKQWLKAFRARQPDQGDTYFLWGTDLACSCGQKTTRDYRVIFTINGGVKIKFYNFQ